MHSNSLTHFVYSFTEGKQKVTNLFYFSTLAISILGLLTSISYTAMYGYDQGVTHFEKISNSIAYGLIDVMLALFFVYLGKKISAQGRAVQDLKIQFLGVILFCLSSLAMVADLSKQNLDIRAQAQHDRIIQTNAQINSYNQQIERQIADLQEANTQLKVALEKVDPTDRPGNYQFIAGKLDKNLSSEKELHAQIKPLQNEEIIIAITGLNSWIAKQTNLTEVRSCQQHSAV